MTRTFPLLLVVAAVGCAGGSERQAAPSNAPERLRCDALAAEAIQMSEAARAGEVASQAAECYRTLGAGPTSP